MMNFQIGPTPPPLGPLPSLSQQEIEQTLYQRRVADPGAMAIETQTDALQSLEINYAQTAYYPHQYQHYHAQHAAPAQRSAPLQNTQPDAGAGAGTAATVCTASLFGKVPPCTLSKDLNAMNISKPPETPSTPPPPLPPTQTVSSTTIYHKATGASSSSVLSVTPQSHKGVVDITSITPQSHLGGVALANSNSASNHSSASNHTTATTALESAASQSSRNGGATTTAAGTAIQTDVSMILPPQLANPLPAVSMPNTSSSSKQLNNIVSTAAAVAAEGIVIPMPHGEYNAWLSQMYGAHAPQQQTPQSYVPNGTTTASYPDTFTYDNPYAMPTAPHNGYYGGGGGYYQAPNTAPAHMAAPPHAPAHAQYPSSTPKSADAYHAFHTFGGYDASAPAATFYHTAPYAHPNPADELTTMTDASAVQYLHRADGTLISPHTNPAHVRPIIGGKDESDPFTAGDDALFGEAVVTIIGVHWQSSIPFATVRIHLSNRIYHVPLLDLTPIDDRARAIGKQHHAHVRKTAADHYPHGKVHPGVHTTTSTTTATAATTTGNNRYRLGVQGMGVEHAHAHAHAPAMEDIVVRRNPKLSDETLMKLPHLRKHREYIRSIDLNMGPRDYNSFRVSVNSKQQQGGHGDQETRGQQQQQPGAAPPHQQQQHHGQQQHQHSHYHHHAHGPRQQQQQPPPPQQQPYAPQQHEQSTSAQAFMTGGNSGRTANIQNLGLSNNKGNLNNLNAGNHMPMQGGGGVRGRRNKRMSVCEKGDLFKTELCENWVKKGHCTYGKKCHFAHGREDIRTRWRIENYKTQPCCDPARADSRLCLFGKRCNYAHPGEPLRRSHHCLYLDEEYEAEIAKDFGQNTPYPFGIYI